MSDLGLAKRKSIKHILVNIIAADVDGLYQTMIAIALNAEERLEKKMQPSAYVKLNEIMI